MYLYIYLTILISIYLPVCLYIYLSACLCFVVYIPCLIFLSPSFFSSFLLYLRFSLPSHFDSSLHFFHFLSHPLSFTTFFMKHLYRIPLFYNISLYFFLFIFLPLSLSTPSLSSLCPPSPLFLSHCLSMCLWPAAVLDSYISINSLIFYFHLLK